MATDKDFDCLNHYLLIATLTHFPVFPFDSPKNRKKCFSDILGELKGRIVKMWLKYGF